MTEPAPASGAAVDADVAAGAITADPPWGVIAVIRTATATPSRASTRAAPAPTRMRAPLDPGCAGVVTPPKLGSPRTPSTSGERNGAELSRGAGWGGGLRLFLHKFAQGDGVPLRAAVAREHRGVCSRLTR